MPGLCASAAQIGAGAGAWGRQRPCDRRSCWGAIAAAHVGAQSRPWGRRSPRPMALPQAMGSPQWGSQQGMRRNSAHPLCGRRTPCGHRAALAVRCARPQLGREPPKRRARRYERAPSHAARGARGPFAPARAACCGQMHQERAAAIDHPSSAPHLDARFERSPGTLLQLPRGPVVTLGKIAEAERYFTAHFSNPVWGYNENLFNRSAWEHIVKVHGGHLPISIKAPYPRGGAGFTRELGGTTPQGVRAVVCWSCMAA